MKTILSALLILITAPAWSLEPSKFPAYDLHCQMEVDLHMGQAQSYLYGEKRRLQKVALDLSLQVAKEHENKRKLNKYSLIAKLPFAGISDSDRQKMKTSLNSEMNALANKGLLTIWREVDDSTPKQILRQVEANLNSQLTYQKEREAAVRKFLAKYPLQETKTKYYQQLETIEAKILAYQKLEAIADLQIERISKVLEKMNSRCDRIASIKDQQQRDQKIRTEAVEDYKRSLGRQATK